MVRGLGLSARRKFRPPHRGRGAARHLPRGRATAQKRHVPSKMRMKAVKGAREGSRANPQTIWGGAVKRPSRGVQGRERGNEVPVRAPW